MADSATAIAKCVTENAEVVCPHAVLVQTKTSLLRAIDSVESQPKPPTALQDTQSSQRIAQELRASALSRNHPFVVLLTKAYSILLTCAYG